MKHSPFKRGTKRGAPQFELDADYASRLKWLALESGSPSTKAFIEERMTRDIDELDIRQRIYERASDYFAEMRKKEGNDDDIPF
jgi:hypothetical protein